MDCDEAHGGLDLLLDAEISPEERHRVLAHLEDCAVCREEFAYRQLLKHAIQQGGIDTEVPAHLWDHIAAALDDVDQSWQSHGRQRMRWALLAGSAVVVTLLMGVLFSSSVLRPPTSAFMAESVNNYIRYLLPDTPYDLQTDDGDRIRQWFQNRVDFMVEPADLRAEGFQLLGARLGYFLDRMVAEMGYQRNGRRLSIFLTKGDRELPLVGDRLSAGGKEFFIGTSKGYTIVAWREDQANIVCSIVADLAREQLLPVAFKVARVQS